MIPKQIVASIRIPNPMKKKKSSPIDDAQALNEIRLRALRVKSGFLSLGTESYMPFVVAQATKEGTSLSVADKLEIRQVVNGRAYPSNKHWLDLVERALETQKQA
jgi:hypothetical protein